MDELMGYCETCQDWLEFNKSDEKWECPLHHTPFSSKRGYQITTKRTWRPKVKR